MPVDFENAYAVARQTISRFRTRDKAEWVKKNKTEKSPELLRNIKFFFLATNKIIILTPEYNAYGFYLIIIIHYYVDDIDD